MLPQARIQGSRAIWLTQNHTTECLAYTAAHYIATGRHIIINAASHGLLILPTCQLSASSILPVFTHTLQLILRWLAAVGPRCKHTDVSLLQHQPGAGYEKLCTGTVGTVGGNQIYMIKY